MSVYHSKYAISVIFIMPHYGKYYFCSVFLKERNHIISSGIYELYTCTNYTTVYITVKIYWKTYVLCPSGSVTAITSNELRVDSNPRASFVVTRDPNVGQLVYVDEEGQITNISANGNNEFTQQEINEGEVINHNVISCVSIV